MLSSHVTVYVPLLAIPRADVSLRPELLYIFKETGINADDVCTLDDIATFWPSRTGLFLVDHNVPRDYLGDRYDFANYPDRKGLVEGIIDHHDNEYVFEDTKTQMKRYDIQKSGSCASLVTRWMMGHPSAQEFSPNAEGGSKLLAQYPEEVRGVAKLLLSAILIDTANLTTRLTPSDPIAARFLADFVSEIDFANFYQNLRSIKTSITGMMFTDLLRRDYKEYKTNLGKLGISTVPRDLSTLIETYTGLVADYTKFCFERGLKVHVIMTATGEGKEFRRGGMVFTNDRNIIEAIKLHGGDKYRMRDTYCAAVFEDIKGDFWVFEQLDLNASRKQIAPLIQQVMEKEYERKSSVFSLEQKNL